MSEESTTKESVSATLDRITTTKHSVRLNGKEIRYTAQAGTIVLHEEAEKEGLSEGAKPRAELFFVAYIRDDIEDQRARPITFSFNGGPGAASVWLHLGILGPRRVETLDDLRTPLAPYKLIDNDSSLLEHSDLVFIDPVSTGLSRAIKGERAGDFHGFRRDIESVGDFIRLFVTRTKRWLSPKYIAGESYGTTRAAALAAYLQERHGLYPNGLMLISSVLDFQTVRPTPGNDLPYPLILPSYTATAWFHNRLKQFSSLEEAMAVSERFAHGRYAEALTRGASLGADERAEVAQTLAELTGLRPEVYERAELRLELARFTKELLRDEARTVGRLDSRFQGIDRDSGGEAPEFDPSLAAITGPYTAGINALIHGELGFQSDLPYEVLARHVNQRWSYKEFEGRFTSVSDSLRKAMSMNPDLRVLFASGLYDLATPYFATRYTIDHLQLDSSLRQNITLHEYPAGHMMYVHTASLERLGNDLTSFIRTGNAKTR